ncbi:MAG: lytic transglycosylase domain-containing protein, partial [Hyphomicrobiales bacterium]|nr:lytic transglycosylase domain-containing protein [Hyphomicrobiales bacterium]
IDILTTAGQTDAARSLVRELWTSGALNGAEEDVVLERHAGDLRPEDHIARLDRLLWDGQAAPARRALPRVPEEWRLLGEARLALAAGQSGADEIAARVPKALQDNPGLRLDLIRWARRQHRLEQAAALIRNPPGDLGRPAAWSAERDTLLRQLLDDGKSDLAYDLATQRGFRESDAESADLEFVSGWIALRRLAHPEVAYGHFVRLHSSVKLPVSIARGAYWSGLAAEARGAADDAHRWFTAAAEQGVTYYGQLAAARLGTAPAPTFPDLPQAGADERNSFEQQEFVRATRQLMEIGAAEFARPFLFRLDANAPTPAGHGLVATLADKAGCLDVALAAAKRANPGVPSLALGFPMIRVETAGSATPPLVLAIIRQESGFDPAAVSRADARGLMQLQPATAKTVAHAIAAPFSAERLLTDPDYNISLGAAYLGRLLDTFNDSLVLAIAAYNAGPARVKQWVATYGDPRDSSVDVVDWIEELPFSETRNYVQRVLENLQVYRLRGGDKARAFTLAHDLSLNREAK